MNIDPLADISPARHIIESDDEDDSPLFEVTASGDSEPPTTAIRIEGQLTPTRTLVFATGKAASHWARGAGFGEQIGVIILNDMQVGLTFKPSWTDAAVVISELFVRLPLWAMHPYVEAILEAIQPERVFVLDIYPTHTYITSAPSPLRTASIRYLTGEAVSTIVEDLAAPFSPPNIIQGTSAAMLLRCHMRKASVLLILLPSPQTIPPPPNKVLPSNLGISSDQDIPWSQSDMQKVQRLLATAAQEPAHPWQLTTSNTPLAITSRRRELDDSNMYI